MRHSNSSPILRRKEKRLRMIVKKMGRVVLAYSGGVDSSLLLKISAEELGADNVFAVAARSAAYPHREYSSARRLALLNGVKFRAIRTHELRDPRFSRNPINRCYYCKRSLFKILKKIASREGIDCVIDGANYDDREDFRYGILAARELGVRSPLYESRLTKKDIRNISRRLGLPTWNKPSFACLVTRLPYNERISAEKIAKIDKAEELFYRHGFKQVRVRLHDDLARIELLPGDVIRLVNKRKLYKRLLDGLKRIGFPFISIDMEGYRSGNMNKTLTKKKKGIIC